MLKKSILFLLVVFLTVFLLAGCGKPKAVPQENILKVEIYYSQQISDLIDDMGDSYSEYFTFNKSDEEFASEVSRFKKRYKKIQRSYAIFLRDYTTEGGMDTEVEQAVENLRCARESVGSILEQTMEGKRITDRKELFSIYIDENQNLRNNVDAFKKGISKVYQK